MAVVYAPPPRVTSATLDSQGAPLSARQRKQVYMHSPIFEPADSPAAMHNVYHPARQQAVVESVKQCRATRPALVVPNIPRPADYKATVNSGHWVVTPAPAGAASTISPSVNHASEGYSAAHGAVVRRAANAAAAAVGSGANGEIHQFHKDGDPVGVVKARAPEHGLPKEYWATNSKLHWTDPRSELAPMRRGQEFHSVRKDMDAGTRKRQELSSEAFGGERCYGKSTEAPKHELRSMQMKDMHWVDSSLDKMVPTEHKQQTTQRRSMSARERSFQNLTVSSGSQFPRQSSSNAELTTPRRTDITTPPIENPEVEARRRYEKNFSDVLFGSAASIRHSPSASRREISRGEPTGSSNCSFLDTQAELVTRRNQSIEQRSRSTQDANGRNEGAVQIWPWQPESPRAPAESATDKKYRHEERSCWDTASIMQAGSEVSRRRRELRHPEGRPQSLNRSASDRKREELASGQMRKGFGCDLAHWDERRVAALPRSPKPSMHARSGTDSPMSHALRGIQLNSPRMRKLESLKSAVVF